MKKTILTVALALIGLQANAASQFCAPNATLAAQALAQTNGSVHRVINRSTTSNGTTFRVVLSEPGSPRDSYTVRTTGGHDCIVLSVQIIGRPTLMNID